MLTIIYFYFCLNDVLGCGSTSSTATFNDIQDFVNSYESRSVRSEISDDDLEIVSSKSKKTVFDSELDCEKMGRFLGDFLDGGLRESFKNTWNYSESIFWTTLEDTETEGTFRYSNYEQADQLNVTGNDNSVNFVAYDASSETFIVLGPTDMAYHICTKDSLPEWTTWYEWTNCTAECGPGTHERFRECKTAGGVAGYCRDEADNIKKTVNFESELCEIRACELSWSSWTNKSCSEECGPGTFDQIRNCTGRDCPSEFELLPDMHTCNNTCASWNNWGSWTACSTTCGDGARLMTRTCPDTTCDGFNISTNKLIVGSCIAAVCPNEWGAWIDQGNCTVMCGGGQILRQRVCPDEQCPNFVQNPDVQTFDCNTEDCISEWSSWSTSGFCSATCGSGVRVYNRTCSDSTCIVANGISNRKTEACHLGPCVCTQDHIFKLSCLSSIIFKIEIDWPCLEESFSHIALEDLRFGTCGPCTPSSCNGYNFYSSYTLSQSDVITNETRTLYYKPTSCGAEMDFTTHATIVQFKSVLTSMPNIDDDMGIVSQSIIPSSELICNYNQTIDLVDISSQFLPLVYELATDAQKIRLPTGFSKVLGHVNTTVEAAMYDNDKILLGTPVTISVWSVSGLTKGFYINQVTTTNGKLGSEQRTLILIDNGCVNTLIFTPNVGKPYSDIEPALGTADGDIYLKYNQYGFFDMESYSLNFTVDVEISLGQAPSCMSGRRRRSTVGNSGYDHVYSEHYKVGVADFDIFELNGGIMTIGSDSTVISTIYATAMIIIGIIL